MSDKPTYEELEQRILELERAEKGRKQVEENLNDQEKVLVDILEDTLSGYWDWDLVNNTEYLSPAFKLMFGYQDHELENSPETWQKMIFPEDLPIALENFDKHVKTRGLHPFYQEVRYRHRDGSTVWVICAGRVIEWQEDGSPVRMVGCHVDVTQQKRTEKLLSSKTGELAERVKELKCMFDIGRIVEQNNVTLAEIIQGTCDLIPAAWHYPEITCARIVIHKNEYLTANYKKTEWKLKTTITVHGQKSGMIEVGLIKKVPDPFEEPFLKEERELIHAIAERLGRIIERKQVEEQLKVSNSRLEALWSVTNLEDISINNVSDHILATTCKMAESEYGFYGFVNEDETAMTIHSWSGNAMKDCSMVNKPTLFQISEAGVWGEAIRRREPLILNDMGADHPAKNGLPHGHVPLTRLLVIPHFSHSRITSVVAVANRGSDYDQDDVNQLTAFLNNVQAIVIAKQAEERLKASEQLFSQIFEQSIVSTQLLSPEGDTLRVNKPFCELFGVTPDAMMHYKIFEDDAIKESDAYEPLLDVISKKEPRRWFNQFDIALASDSSGVKTNRPEKVYLENLSYPVLDDSGDLQYIVIQHHDITKRRQAEEARMRAESQLRQSQKLEAVGTMVGGISHELNNILQSLFLHGGLVKDNLPEDNELLANFEQMLRDGERAKNIVKQVLTFSRKSSMNMQPQKVHELIQEALVVQKASLPANIKLNQDIDADCGLVLCDSTQVHQIIFNLCNNAQHAMEESGGVLTISLEQVKESLNNIDPETDVLALKVTDTGHGIDPEDLGNIFDPFFTTKQSGRGTGLGLSVIHGIIDMMGGQISVTSKPNEGTTFRILFPVTDVIPQEDYNESAEYTDVMSLSILLVDDEDSIREATEFVLAHRGHLVDSAINGEKALELFTANPGKYDLIVTDQSMPKMSGVELTKAIRNTQSNIPVILSTGHLGVEEEQGFKDIGITAFIQKPWTADELIARIQEIDNKPVDTNGSN